MIRDSLLQYGLLGLTGGISGAAFAVLYRTGFQSDDVFAFSGALVGAAATVAGGAWLAERAVRAERASEHSIVNDALLAALMRVESAQKLLGSDGEWLKGFRPIIHTIWEPVIEAEVIVKQALMQARTLNFRQRARLEAVQIAIAAFKSHYNDSFGESDPDPMDERDWGGTLRYLADHLEAALQQMQPR